MKEKKTPQLNKMIQVLSIQKTFPLLEYDTKSRSTEPFIITTGYLRFAIDSTLPDKESASVLIKVDPENNANLSDKIGYLITREQESIIKIAQPKKYIATKIYPNFGTTLVFFGNNGISAEHPFKVGEYVTITGAVDDSYNQAIVHIKILERQHDTITLDIDLSGYSELNSAFSVNVSTRVLYMSPRGQGLLSMTEVRPVG